MVTLPPLTDVDYVNGVTNGVTTLLVVYLLVCGSATQRPPAPPSASPPAPVPVFPPAPVPVFPPAPVPVLPPAPVPVFPPAPVPVLSPAPVPVRYLSPDQHIFINADERQGPDEFGNYNFEFETGDGISRHEQGAPQGETGAVASQGGWSFTFPDGTPADFNFVADEYGYRVESDLLPTPPPLPAHAIAQIEKARQEDAATVTSQHYTVKPPSATPPFPPPSPFYRQP
ncbi:endocuticle structural glycoprotein SgAbd-1-like [Homarus americanus]|uniref:endocuticle structural glycoprotein SgAbd-1-like n=1 Tax=Homarus americanus TaxID=6706 RepID=UPI001C43959E|nr:endocuticle structural glycoprotein SgAbd-1-like [Homarus americanus]